MKIDLSTIVIWLDEALLAVDKPAGLSTLPDGYDPEEPFLVGILKNQFQALWVVHRLDKETSGVMVFARTADAHRVLNTQFERHNVTKVYHALVKGKPNWDEKLVRQPLRANGDRKHRTSVDRKRGKPAETYLHVLEGLEKYTLVEVIPRSGRTHQIRAHLASTGFPIAADKLYGDGRGIFLSDHKSDYKSKENERPLIDRLCLHAWSLTLEHPSSGEEMRFVAPYATDFAAALTQLRKLLPTIRSR